MNEDTIGTTTVYSPDVVSVNGLPSTGRFTDAQVDELLAYMRQQGESRKRAQGDAMSEPDFLAGCMAALQAVGRWDKVPVDWVFGPMAGRKVFGYTKEDGAR